MKRVFILLFLTAGICFIPVSLQAQYIIEQETYSVPVNYDLVPEDTEFEGMEDEALFFLNLDDTKLKEAAEMNGDELAITNAKVYISDKNFAYESNEEQGKVSMISDIDKGMFYYVLWDQKKVFTLNKEDMQKFQDQTKSASERMLDKLSPEMREQMEENKSMTENEPGEKPVVESTGKKATKYGFNCEQYLIKTEEEIQLVWATKSTAGLSQKMKSFTKQIETMFPSESGESEDEWDLIPGKMPIETRIFRQGMMSDPEIEVEATTKIVETMPPAEKFIPPGEKEGFTTGSMADMMKQMMDMMFGEE